MNVRKGIDGGANCQKKEIRAVMAAGVCGEFILLSKGLKTSPWFRWQFFRKMMINQGRHSMEAVSAKSVSRVRGLNTCKSSPSKLSSSHPRSHKMCSITEISELHSISMQQSIAAPTFVWKLLKIVFSVFVVDCHRAKAQQKVGTKAFTTKLN